MKMLLPALAATLAFAGAAEAQIAGPCASGYRWSAENGTARFEVCNGPGALLTLSCDGSDTIRGTLAGTPGRGVLATDSAAAPLWLRPGDSERVVTFDLPRDYLDSLARASTARVSTPGAERSIHLRGSAAAIAEMLDTCSMATVSPARQPVPEPQNNEPPEGDPLQTGTAPDEAVIEAFRAAWTPERPEPLARDAPAPARCSAVAGGPMAGFGSDDAVPFAALDATRETLVICKAALAAEPGLPQHAFHTARLHLALGEDAAAMALIRRAARAGYPPAANALAVAILAGRTAPEPGEDTAELLTLAAEVGYPPALANLAIGGTNAGPLADHPTALRFARQAAALGDPVAATLMGSMAFHGAGLPNDAELATRWFKIGAARGDPDALVALADILGPGDGPSETYRDAAIAAGHRTTILSHGLSAPGAVPEERLIDAIGADPIRHAWENGLLYLGDGRDSDGTLFRTLMRPRRAGSDLAGGAVDLDPLLSALAGRYDCVGGRLFKITASRLGCAR